MNAAGELQSRRICHARMLNALAAERRKHGCACVISNMSLSGIQQQDPVLPKDTKFGRAINVCARVLGHLVASILFWIGFAVWIGFSPPCHWSDKWQLYINSASSAFTMFGFCFLM